MAQDSTSPQQAIRRRGAERNVLLLLRLAMAWVFLYAASHQVFVPGWSAAGFLSHTKTFNWLFAPLANPAIAPLVSFLVEYGHLLIGLSLLAGLFTRASSIAAIILMILYWMAHMDFPFIGNANNFLLDEHIVYALVLWLLIVVKAGHISGADTLISNMDWAKRQPFFRWATS